MDHFVQFLSSLKFSCRTLTFSSYTYGQHCTVTRKT